MGSSLLNLGGFPAELLDFASSQTFVMARATRASPLLVLAVAAATVLTISQMGTPAFSQPPAESRRSALLGGLAAGAAGLVAAQPAQAAKFSFFGFGAEGSGAMSDAYAINDVDAYSPYSPFSGNSAGENIYKPYSSDIMEKKRQMVRLSEKIIRERVPPALAAKNKEEVKQETTRQVYMMQDSMNYLADGVRAATGDDTALNVGLRFKQEIADMQVSTRIGNFEKANQGYDTMMNTLAEFKGLTGF